MAKYDNVKHTIAAIKDTINPINEYNIVISWLGLALRNDYSTWHYLGNSRYTLDTVRWRVNAIGDLLHIKIKVVSHNKPGLQSESNYHFSSTSLGSVPYKDRKSWVKSFSF